MVRETAKENQWRERMSGLFPSRARSLSFSTKGRKKNELRACKVGRCRALVSSLPQLVVSK